MRDTEIPRTTLVDEIVARLERHILNNRYRPGDVLPPERELATTFGVTRTSVKHALVRLEQLGMIRTRHGVGSIVQAIEESGGADLLARLLGVAGSTFVAEILEARTHVVAAFVRLAATRRTRDELARMRVLLTAIETLPAGDVPAVQRTENALVRLWARASRNRAFQLLANSVTFAYRMDLARYAAQFADRRWLLRRLVAIVDAIEARDGETAYSAATRYFDEAARRITESRRS